MNYLILGAGGMSGHLISIYLSEQGEQVTGIARRGLPYCRSVILDVTDFEALSEIIISGDYDIILNCAGLLNERAENNQAQAVLINSYLPFFLKCKTEKTKCRVFHISTDCVFSGKTGGYTEKSYTDASTFYGRTKALGELLDEKNLTFRTSIVGPDINENGIGLFNWFMRSEDNIKGYEKSVWSGVTTLTLAKAVYKAGRNKIAGLYHLVNNEKISKYDLLHLFKIYTKKEIEIVKINGDIYDKSLINTRTDFNFEILSYAEQVKEMCQWIKEHKELYPAYFIGGG